MAEPKRPSPLLDGTLPRLRSMLAGAIAAGLAVEMQVHPGEASHARRRAFTVVLGEHRRLLLRPEGRSVSVSLIDENRGEDREITQNAARRLLEAAIADLTPQSVTPAAGQIWRRRKTHALVRVTEAINVGSATRPYYDVGWETLGRPTRRGRSYETYWLRDCEYVAASVDDPAASGHATDDRRPRE